MSDISLVIDPPDSPAGYTDPDAVILKGRPVGRSYDTVQLRAGGSVRIGTGYGAPTKLEIPAVATNQEQYLTRYYAAVAAGSVKVVNYGDSLSAFQGGGVTWDTWPFLWAKAMVGSMGSGECAATPATDVAFRLYNRSINASQMSDHITAGLAADLATVSPHLVVMSCGVATWLADKTGNTYMTSLSTGLAAIRAAAPNADVLIVHEHEPSLAIDATNNFTGVGIATEQRARNFAQENGCAFVSLYRPFGTAGGDGDPRDVLIADNIHPNAGGQQLMWDTLSPLLVRNKRTLVGSNAYDLGQQRSTSAAELSLLTAAMSIPANTLQRGDLVRVEFQATNANLSGGALTETLKLKVGATTVLNSGAMSVANLAGNIYRGFLEIFVEAISPSPILRVESRLTYGPGSNAAATATLMNSTANTPLSDATTAAISIDFTSQHSSASAGFVTECTWAKLWKV